MTPRRYNPDPQDGTSCSVCRHRGKFIGRHEGFVECRYEGAPDPDGRWAIELAHISCAFFTWDNRHHFEVPIEFQNAEQRRDAATYERAVNAMHKAPAV